LSLSRCFDNRISPPAIATARSGNLSEYYQFSHLAGFGELYQPIKVGFAAAWQKG
jgi:hypothetical protein